MPAILLMENECYRVERHVAPAYLRVTRTSVAFRSREHCDAMCGQVERALDQAGRASAKLLIDSRDAVGRNDDEYERWFAPHRQAMLVDFPRVAILMRTAIGKLHADRALRTASGLPGEVRVTVDEREAIAWLTEGPASSR